MILDALSLTAFENSKAGKVTVLVEGSIGPRQEGYTPVPHNSLFIRHQPSPQGPAGLFDLDAGKRRDRGIVIPHLELK